MSDMQDIISKNRRLAILRFLSEEQDYAMNTSTLQAALRAIGHGVPRDTVEADAFWLAEQGLARCRRLDVGVTVLTVTPRGVEVAQGIAGHPGEVVAMPRTSKVRRLPPELREQLHAMLDAGHTLEEITAHLKALGADVSRSGLGRYKQQVDKVAARLRESRAMAEAVMERMGAQAATGKSGAALIEMLTTLTSDYLLRRMDDPDAEIEVDELRALARTVKERAQAARATQDYDLKLREEARREAEEAMRKAVEKAAEESPAAAGPAELFARIQAVYRGEA